MDQIWDRQAITGFCNSPGQNYWRCQPDTDVEYREKVKISAGDCTASQLSETIAVPFVYHTLHMCQDGALGITSTSLSSR